MEPRLTELNYNEILMYLGHRGQEITPEVEGQIRRCMEEIARAAEPRLVYRRLALAGGAIPGLPLAGEDIQGLLAESREAVLMAVTLGPGIERLLMRREVTDMADAVILDCCASSAIENVCDNLCADLEAEFSPRYLTDRFSPGYGDLPFAQQPDFCRVLDLSRRIGVNLSPGGLMIPQKSVTAILGIADIPQNKRFRGCAHCSAFETCTLRKENRSCGKV